MILDDKELLVSCSPQGLLTWREENPSTRRILEGGSSLRRMFSVFGLHPKGYTCP